MNRSDQPEPALLHSVNVGTPQPATYRGKTIMTAIWKSPVQGKIAARGVNLSGDDQGDRSVHGGPDKAVYAYAQEDLLWWSTEITRPLEPGAMGENLTTIGVDVSGARVGERWRIGSAVFEVAQPRLPCFKLGIRMGNARFPKRFGLAGRPGAYLRIVQEGEIEAGDPVEVIDRPDHTVTVALALRARLHEPELAPVILTAPQLPERWHQWARDASSR